MHMGLNSILIAFLFREENLNKGKTNSWKQHHWNIKCQSWYG